MWCGQGSHIYDVGCNAIQMSGGDVPSLTPGHMRVHNNSLHRFARVTRTRSVGVSWSGCGGTVSANEIFDGPCKPTLPPLLPCTIPFTITTKSSPDKRGRHSL